jgi:hypothetical protein
MGSYVFYIIRCSLLKLDDWSCGNFSFLVVPFPKPSPYSYDIERSFVISYTDVRGGDRKGRRELLVLFSNVIKYPDFLVLDLFTNH